MLSNLKNNIIEILLFIILILGFILYVHIRELKKEKELKEDYKNLHENSQKTFKTWQSKDGKNYASTEQLYLNTKEVFNQVVAQESLLKDLSVKLNKLEGFRIQSTESKFHFYTNLKDSILYDSIKIKVFKQVDSKGYYTFNGEIINDSIKATLSASDTIVSGITRSKCQNRILWGLIGVSNRKYLVETVNKNPFVKITANKEVYLKKD